MREQVLKVLKEIRPDVDFENEQNLLDEGVLESFDVIQVVTSLMDVFDIYIDADDIEPENLNSLNAICKLVEMKMSEK